MRTRFIARYSPVVAAVRAVKAHNAATVARCTRLANAALVASNGARYYSREYLAANAMYINAVQARTYAIGVQARRVGELVKDANAVLFKAARKAAGRIVIDRRAPRFNRAARRNGAIVRALTLAPVAPLALVDAYDVINPCPGCAVPSRRVNWEPRDGKEMAVCDECHKATCDGCSVRAYVGNVVTGADGNTYCDECARTCEECDNVVCESDTQWLEDSERCVCDSCYESLTFRCYECRERCESNDGENSRTLWNGEEVCESCYENGYFTCEDCGEAYPDSRAASTAHGWYCSDCRNGRSECSGKSTDFAVFGFQAEQRHTLGEVAAELTWRGERLIEAACACACDGAAFTVTRSDWDAIGRESVNRAGKFAKRFAKHFKQVHGIKLDTLKYRYSKRVAVKDADGNVKRDGERIVYQDKQVTMSLAEYIANAAAENSAAVAPCTFSLTREFERGADYFVNGDSCWFEGGSYGQSLCRLKAARGFAFVTFGERGYSPERRAWGIPVEVRDGDVSPCHERDANAVLLLNGYSRVSDSNPETMCAALAAQAFDMVSKRVYWNPDGMYVNDGSAYIIGRASDVADVTHVDFECRRDCHCG